MDVFATWQIRPSPDGRNVLIRVWAPHLRGFPSAPERTRTSTDHTVHKALNLARLPIPPQALEAASIDRGGPSQGACWGVSVPLALVGLLGARPDEGALDDAIGPEWTRPIESVLKPR